jgi:outer membrane receptor protein involved in Fe transport
MSRFGSGAYNYSLPDLLGEQYFKRENASLFNWRTRVLAGYQHKKNKLLLSFTTFNNEQELPGAVVLYNPSNDQMLWNKDMRMMMRHTWQNKIWKITSTIAAENTYTRYLDPFFLNLQGFIDARYTNQNFNGGTIVNRLFQNNSLRVFLGSDLYFSSLKTNNLAAEPSRISNNTVIGVSKEYSKLIIDGNVSLQLINDEYTSNNSTEVNQFKQLSPFISVAYLPFKKSALKVRGFYKRTFRMPTFNDLYYNFIGNTMLKPEQGNMLDLGLAYTLSKKNFSIEMTADAFLNYIQNKIIAIPVKHKLKGWILPYSFNWI